MSKRLILVLALAFVVAFSLSAYAEVQNVKVSGDLTIMGISRENLDLGKARPASASTTPVTHQDHSTNAISITRVKVDADLTDNVSTTVRLLNERTWGQEDETNGNTSVDLDLAYATLKEFLYSPLTLTLGRQELHFGNDFIIGDPDTNNYAAAKSHLSTYERDLSARKSFDAARATLNYDPLVVDLIWAKVFEGANTANDDTTLSGINANYALTKQTTLEGYFFSKIKDSGTTPVTSYKNVVNKADKVFTVGGRVADSTIKNLKLGLESAFQFGTINPQDMLYYGSGSASSNNAESMHRQAWALEATGTYDLKDLSLLSTKLSKYAPSVGLLYAYFSGDNPAQKSDTKAWYGWDQMYKNKTYGHLANVLFDTTNLSIIGANGKVKIVDDVTFGLDYFYYWLNKAYANGDYVYLRSTSDSNQYTMLHNNHLGQEIDAKLTYDYTEDVQFSLLGGIFLPGTAFAKGTRTNNDGETSGNRNVASEVIGSMKVTF